MSSIDCSFCKSGPACIFVGVIEGEAVRFFGALKGLILADSFPFVALLEAAGLAFDLEAVDGVFIFTGDCKKRFGVTLCRFGGSVVSASSVVDGETTSGMASSLADVVEGVRVNAGTRGIVVGDVGEELTTGFDLIDSNVIGLDVGRERFNCRGGSGESSCGPSSKMASITAFLERVIRSKEDIIDSYR